MTIQDTNQTRAQGGKLRAKVVLVSPTFYPAVGGVETCAREVAAYALRAGAAVSVITTDATRRLNERDLHAGVQIRRLKAYPRNSDLRFAPGTPRALAEEHADLIHVQCYQGMTAPMAMATAARAKIPYVVTFHGGGHSSPVRHAMRARQIRGISPLLRRASALVATARWEIDVYGEMLRLPRDRFSLIPNGGDVPIIPSEQQRSPIPFIVSLGRLERYKGHQYVIRALPVLSKIWPDIRLWIAGEGPYRDRLEELTRQLDLSGRVRIGAITDRRTYGKTLASAWAVAMLSDFETHPMAALETTALGIPLVVAHNSGLAELAENGYAESLQNEERADPTLVASAIRRACERRVPEIKVSTWAECGEAHLNLYRKILGHNA